MKPTPWVTALALIVTSCAPGDRPPDARIEEAARIAAEGDHDTAARLLREVVAADPDNAEAHFRLGVLLEDARDDKAAVESLATAVKLDPKLIDAYLALGSAYLRLEDRRSAFLAFNEAARLDPNSASAWFNLGVMYYLDGKHDTAVDALRKARSLRPDDPGIQFRLGMAEMNQGSMRDAKLSFNAALKLDPSLDEAWLNQANACTVLGDYEEAEAALERALELRPGWSDALNGRGVLARARDRSDEALDWFTQALAADPNNARVRLNLGSLHEARGDKRRAIAEYRTFLEQWQGDLATSEKVRRKLEILGAPASPAGS